MAACRVILAASGPLTTPEIARQMAGQGVEAKNASQIVFALREAGAIERVTTAQHSRAYVAGDAHELQMRAGLTDALTAAEARREPKVSNDKPQVKKRRTKRAKALSPSPTRPPRLREVSGFRAGRDAEVPPLLCYAISETGDLQITRADGTGEAAVITRQEVLRLHAFIEMAMPIIGQADPEKRHAPERAAA